MRVAFYLLLLWAVMVLGGGVPVQAQTELVSASASLLVAIAALLVAVGALIVFIKLARVLERMEERFKE